MTTFGKINQLLSEVLPVVGVSAIVCEYMASHKVEWTKNLMRGVCAQIRATVAVQPIHIGKKYLVRSFVRQSTIMIVHKKFAPMLPTFNKINSGRRYNVSSVDRLIRYGILCTKPARPNRCYFCGQKNVPTIFVHRVGQRSTYMCEQCDTQKIYTPRYATGFRALPNRVQQFIVDGLNARISLSAICYDLHLRKIEIGVSYATLFRWMKREDMH